MQDSVKYWKNADLTFNIFHHEAPRLILLPLNLRGTHAAHMTIAVIQKFLRNKMTAFHFSTEENQTW